MSFPIAGARQAAAEPFASSQAQGVSRLTLSYDIAGPVTRLTLTGTLDSASVAPAYDTIVAAAMAPTTTFHLDLVGLRRASRAACRPIHVAARLLHVRGGRMIIHGARPEVEQALKNNGFDSQLSFSDAPAPAAIDALPVRAVDPAPSGVAHGFVARINGSRS